MAEQSNTVGGMLQQGFKGAGVLFTLAWLVCGPAHAQDPRFVIRGADVFDKITKLTWQRCSVGQRWREGDGRRASNGWREGDGCFGKVTLFTFAEAQQQGGGGWRVPTKDELSTTLLREATTPRMDIEAFPDMDIRKLWYWTSTPYFASDAWGVYFGNGNYGGVGSTAVRSDGRAVRLVRRGQ